jgi:DNA-binding transcriptional MocR family regulator
MRGVVVDSELVVICCAASQALTVLWHVLRGRGVRRVAIEDPGWRWQRYTAEMAGLAAVPIRVDADGLIVDDLIAAGVDAVVMTPAHHYPTGVVMTPSRRAALIAWARHRNALIVEDDYDVEYRFGRPPMASLQGLAPDLVAFVGTTSKTLAPALRLAWMVPPARLIDDVENALLVTGVTPPTLDQLAMATFIENAALERHLRAMRRRYRAKREVLIGALARHVPDVRVGGTAAGLHLVAWLPDGADEHETAMRARAGGVGLMSCTATAPRTRRRRRPCCSASRCRASPSWRLPPGSLPHLCGRTAAPRLPEPELAPVPAGNRGHGCVGAAQQLGRTSVAAFCEDREAVNEEPGQRQRDDQHEPRAQQSPHVRQSLLLASIATPTRATAP